MKAARRQLTQGEVTAVVTALTELGTPAAEALVIDILEGSADRDRFPSYEGMRDWATATLDVANIILQVLPKGGD